MKAIIIDSTAERLAIIAINGEKRHDFIGQNGMRRHTSEILVRIDECLNAVSAKAIDLDYIGVVVGPGSFTGIRIGVGTANAMAHACGAKVVAITALECHALDKSDALVLLDCKHNNYYAMLKQGETKEYIALNEADLPNYSVPKIFITDINCNGMYESFCNKVANGQFSDSVEPFYMKKSSAEMQK